MNTNKFATDVSNMPDDVCLPESCSTGFFRIDISAKEYPFPVKNVQRKRRRRFLLFFVCYSNKSFSRNWRE